MKHIIDLSLLLLLFLLILFGKAVSCFADDTRILLGIKDEEDTQMLQNDLHKLCKWADTNNMKFNANKLELLRYGKEEEIKSAITFKSYDDSNIDDKEQVRDRIYTFPLPRFTDVLIL